MTIYSFSWINNEFRLRANEQVYAPSEDFCFVNDLFSELVCYCIISAGFSLNMTQWFNYVIRCPLSWCLHNLIKLTVRGGQIWSNPVIN